MRKEKNRSVIYIAIFVALIMALSVIGFLWGGQDEGRHSYKGFSFSYKNGKWITNVEGKSLEFSYLPEDVSDITVPQDAKILLSGARMAYIAYSPEEDSEELALVQYNLGKNLEAGSIFVINALTLENKNSLPVINCQNATQFVPVILIKKSVSANSIILNNWCLILEGEPEMLADRLVYDAYGVII